MTTTVTTPPSVSSKLLSGMSKSTSNTLPTTIISSSPSGATITTVRLINRNGGSGSSSPTNISSSSDNNNSMINHLSSTPTIGSTSTTTTREQIHDFQSMRIEDSSNLGFIPHGTRCKNFYAEHCIYLPAMLGWFFFSAALSSYNKVVFGNNHQAFPCPLLLTSIHFLAQWIFGYVVSTLFPIYIGTDRITGMTWKEWWSTSFPCGLVTSGDVGLSNLSLVTISMTFYTMIKSSTPIFVLMWAYFFGIEKITWNLLFVVLIIAIGEVLTVTGEVDFHPGGFTLCLAASILSGARWTLVQLKLRSMDPPLKTTIATMRLLAPSMFWSMLVVSLLIERPWSKLGDRSLRDNIYDIFFLGMIGATIAISMILCEFWLIMRSNAIVLMIGGVIKEMITIFVGVYFFGDELNRVNISGCFVVFVGVLYFKITHYADSKQQQAKAMMALSTLRQSDDEMDRDDDTTNPNDDDTDRGLDDSNNGTPNTGNTTTTNVAHRPNTLRSRSGGNGGNNSNILYSKVSIDSSDRGDNTNNTTTTTTTFLQRRSNSRALETGESTAESCRTPITMKTTSSLDSLC